MKPGEIAEEYLRAHEEYVEALKALLRDLGQAWSQGERARCDLLCDALIHMQRTAREQEAAKGESSPGSIAPPPAGKER